MFWAALVASGVAVVSMTLFGAWLTRRPPTDPPAEEFAPSADPADPWAAYRPRPFEEVSDRQRPRLWPVVTALTGLVLVGGGIAGARQNMRLEAIATAPTPRPYVFEVETTPVPTVAPTPVPTVAPKPVVAAAPKPQAPAASAPTKAPAPKPAASGAAPTITGSAGCSGGSINTSFTINGTNLSWFGLYIDKQVQKGGPISGNSYSSSASKTVSPGDHEVEITAEDKAGQHARKLFQVHCG